jgi:hypothetical protein
MAKLLPVLKIAAMKNRNAGKIFEAAGDQIEVAPDPANAGIGIESGKNRIAKAVASA